MRTTKWAKLTLASILAIGSWTGVAWAGVPIQAATDEQREAASNAYVTAKEAFDAGRFEEALSGFRASYDVVSSPNARLMIIASLSELGRHAEAYQEVGPAIVEAREAAAIDSKYESTVTSLEAAEADLRGKVGLVTVNVTGPVGEVTIDGKPVAPDALDRPIAVEPGPHRVEMIGAEPQDIDVAAGAAVSVDLGASEEEGGDVGTDDGGGNWFIDNRRTIAYAAGGLGAVNMVLFAAFGGLTLSTESDLETACGPQKICPPESAADIDDGKTYQALANAGLAIGIIGLSAGVGLFVWDVLDEDASEETAVDPRLQVVAGAGHLGLVGTF